MIIIFFKIFIDTVVFYDARNKSLVLMKFIENCNIYSCSQLGKNEMNGYQSYNKKLIKRQFDCLSCINFQKYNVENFHVVINNRNRFCLRCKHTYTISINDDTTLNFARVV